MEIWDLYDENKNKVGKDWIRGEQIPDNYYHLVVHVWIKNKDGKYLISQRSVWSAYKYNNPYKYLISQRSENRKMHPLMWECVGGSVLKGETSLEGAIREVQEEVGINLSNHVGKIVFSQVRKIWNGKKFNDIMDAWLFEYDGIVDLNNATTDEVKQIKWLDKSEIKELFDQGKFVPTLSYFFEKIL